MNHTVTNAHMLPLIRYLKLLWRSPAGFILFLLSPLILLGFQASRFETPAQNRAAYRRFAGPSVLPGGRIISPVGKQLMTGPGPFGLGVSLGGKVATTNLGPERLSYTVWEVDKKALWSSHNYLAAKPLPPGAKDGDEQELRSTFLGIVFSGEKLVWMTEGNSGRVRSVDPLTGERHGLVSLNTSGYQDSFSGDLALDPARNILYVTDQANFRICAIDAKKGRLLSSVRVGRLPFAIALAPDGKTAYVTHTGVFEYSQIPGATKRTALDMGLSFPAFGFPSAGGPGWSGAHAASRTGDGARLRRSRQT